MHVGLLNYGRRPLPRRVRAVMAAPRCRAAARGEGTHLHPWTGHISSPIQHRHPGGTGTKHNLIEFYSTSGLVTKTQLSARLPERPVRDYAFFNCISKCSAWNESRTHAACGLSVLLTFKAQEKEARRVDIVSHRSSPDAFSAGCDYMRPKTPALCSLVKSCAEDEGTMCNRVMLSLHLKEKQEDPISVIILVFNGAICNIKLILLCTELAASGYLE